MIELYGDFIAGVLIWFSILVLWWMNRSMNQSLSKLRIDLEQQKQEAEHLRVAAEQLKQQADAGLALAREQARVALRQLEDAKEQLEDAKERNARVKIDAVLANQQRAQRTLASDMKKAVREQVDSSDESGGPCFSLSRRQSERAVSDQRESDEDGEQVSGLSFFLSQGDIKKIPAWLVGQIEQLEVFCALNPKEVALFGCSILSFRVSGDVMERWIKPWLDMKNAKVLEARRLARGASGESMSARAKHQVAFEEETGIPYTGAIGGGETYSFGHTRDGLLIHVDHALSKTRLTIYPNDSRPPHETDLRALADEPPELDPAFHDCALLFAFAPTSLGHVKYVRHVAIGNDLNLTDYDSW